MWAALGTIWGLLGREAYLRVGTDLYVPWWYGAAYLLIFAGTFSVFWYGASKHEGGLRFLARDPLVNCALLGANVTMLASSLPDTVWAELGVGPERSGVLDYVLTVGFLVQMALAGLITRLGVHGWDWQK